MSLKDLLIELAEKEQTSLSALYKKLGYNPTTCGSLTRKHRALPKVTRRMRAALLKQFPNEPIVKDFFTTYDKQYTAPLPVAPLSATPTYRSIAAFSTFCKVNLDVTLCSLRVKIKFARGMSALGENNRLFIALDSVEELALLEQYCTSLFALYAKEAKRQTEVEITILGFKELNS